jgi:hypothetical protein
MTLSAMTAIGRSFFQDGGNLTHLKKAENFYEVSVVIGLSFVVSHS